MKRFEEDSRIIIERDQKQYIVKAADGGYTIRCSGMSVPKSVRTIKANMIKGGYSPADILIVNNSGVFFGSL
jgi:hypothetical protein